MGNSSLVVSLPSRWIKMCNIKKGDVVDIKELSTGELVISPGEPLKAKKKVSISVESNNFEKVIIYSYLNGADIIEIKADASFTDNKLSQIYETLEFLSGFEIVEVFPDKVVVEYVGGEIPIKKLLKRVVLIVTNYLKAIVQIHKEGNPDSFKTLKRFREVDKVYYLILRTLLKSLRDTEFALRLGINYKDIVYYTMITRALMDTVKHVNKYSFFEKDQKLSTLWKKTLDYHMESFIFFESCDIEKILERMKDMEEFMKEIHSYDIKVDYLKPEKQQPIEDALNIMRAVLANIEENLETILLYSMKD